jgi:hypothetical protein
VSVEILAPQFAVAPIVWLLLGAGGLMVARRGRAERTFAPTLPSRLNLGVRTIAIYDGQVVADGDARMQVWLHQNGDVFELAGDPTPEQVWIDSAAIPPQTIFSGVKNGQPSGAYECGNGEWTRQSDMATRMTQKPWLEARVTVEGIEWSTAAEPGQVFGQCTADDPGSWLSSRKAIRGPDLLVLGFDQRAYQIFASDWRGRVFFKDGDLIFEGPSFASDATLQNYAHDPQLGAITMDRMGRSPRPIDVLLWMSALNADVDAEFYLEKIGNRDENVWERLLGGLGPAPRPGFLGLYNRRYYAVERALDWEGPDPFAGS